MNEYIGLIGLGLLLIGWLTETYYTIKARHCDIHPSFAILYFIGSSLVAYHAYNLGDIVFIVLNTAAALIALVNIYFIFFGKKVPNVSIAQAKRKKRKVKK